MAILEVTNKKADTGGQSGSPSTKGKSQTWQSGLPALTLSHRWTRALKCQYTVPTLLRLVWLAVYNNSVSTQGLQTAGPTLSLYTFALKRNRGRGLGRKALLEKQIHVMPWDTSIAGLTLFLLS